MATGKLSSLILITLFFVSCSKNTGSGAPLEAPEALPEALSQSAQVSQDTQVTMEEDKSNLLLDILQRAEIPEDLADAIMLSNQESPDFIMNLLEILGEEAALRALVDKAHRLPDGYAPDDLVLLPREEASYTVSRSGMYLRTPAEGALEEMAAAARADGITLMASSTYRSYDYQVTVYNRIVDEMGVEAADRESARPGYSQHQTGLVVDFGSITDAFAETRAGRWMASHANEYGWSLSFPDGYEAITGYRWESWHYRYLGVPLCDFINQYFGGIQQYGLRFIYEWENNQND
ncbi:MAG: M15 family metallopeptidase [Spirochaetaceae bacterium]|jgi:D-alanyl-D-alanine carboxypeptidase|nr:M15 family metallopeptidase [Spirochaetaceae bacterium]